MPRARRHAETRSRERRHRLAHEAARLVAESGVSDLLQARRKAADRLGIHDEASLPLYEEIEDALRQHQRLFSGPLHLDALRLKREAALQAMTFFEDFSPRLVGGVLDGIADPHAPVSLHLHADAPEAIVLFLDRHRIPAESRVRRLRLDRQRDTDVDVWQFSADSVAFELAVLPMACLRQAPLSNIDDRPVRRASRSQLERLLAGDQPGAASVLPGRD